VPTKEVPITPEVLAWAIQESGYSRAEIAERIREEEPVVRSWMTGATRPGVTQFRKLASALHRPSATLLLPAPPRMPLPPVAFRHPPGREQRSFSVVERRRLREAIRLQKGLKWVSSELHEADTRLPKYDTDDDPEEAAQAVREMLGVGAKTQMGWSGESTAFRSWRDRAQAGWGSGNRWAAPSGDEEGRIRQPNGGNLQAGARARRSRTR